LNRAILRALKPHAAYVVVDHSARREDRDRVSATLHRIAEDLVLEEVRNAGFLLAATADFLRYPADDRRTLAWTHPQPTTDRFALRFVKP
jgi:predicted methyltransferase